MLIFHFFPWVIALYFQSPQSSFLTKRNPYVWVKSVGVFKFANTYKKKYYISFINRMWYVLSHRNDETRKKCMILCWKINSFEKKAKFKTSICNFPLASGVQMWHLCYQKISLNDSLQWVKCPQNIEKRWKICDSLINHRFFTGENRLWIELW